MMSISNNSVKRNRMPKSQMSLGDKHRNFLDSMARRITNRKRNNMLNFVEVTNALNDKYGTKFSIYQVSAYLGNMGWYSGATSSWNW